jgi:hypothetical protein
LWRYGDGLFFEVPPLALLTTLHPLLENVLQTVCRKLQEDRGTGCFDLFMFKKKNIAWGDIETVFWIISVGF